MPDITAEQAAEELAHSVITNFTDKPALDGRSAQITNTSVRVWNDIIEVLRLKTQSCGGGLLELNDLEVINGNITNKIGIALFLIGKKSDRGFIGTTWHEENRTCAIYGHECEFPPVLKTVLERYKEKHP